MYDLPFCDHVVSFLLGSSRVALVFFLWRAPPLSALCLSCEFTVGMPVRHAELFSVLLTFISAQFTQVFYYVQRHHLLLFLILRVKPLTPKAKQMHVLNYSKESP